MKISMLGTVPVQLGLDGTSVLPAVLNDKYLFDHGMDCNTTTENGKRCWNVTPDWWVIPWGLPWALGVV